MCIISNSVNKVSDTKILIAVNEKTDRQLVVYSNKVDNNSAKNAMILPVPMSNSVKFINLSNYKNIFEDCEKVFIMVLDVYLYHLHYHLVVVIC